MYISDAHNYKYAGRFVGVDPEFVGMVRFTQI